MFPEITVHPLFCLQPTPPKKKLWLMDKIVNIITKYPELAFLFVQFFFLSFSFYPTYSVAGIPLSKLVESHGNFSHATCTTCRKKYKGHEIKVCFYFVKLSVMFCIFFFYEPHSKLNFNESIFIISKVALFSFLQILY